MRVGSKIKIKSILYLAKQSKEKIWIGRNVQSQRFYHLGQWVYRWKTGIVVLWIALILASIPFLTYVDAPFESTGFVVNDSTSVQLDNQLKKSMPYYKNRFMILFQSDRYLTTSPEFKARMKYALQPLKNLAWEHQVIAPESDSRQYSKDKHAAYVTLAFKNNAVMDASQLEQIQSALRIPKHMKVVMGGEAVFMHHIEQQTQKDLFRADKVAAPASILTLILIFGSLIAALLPMLLGGGCGLIILVSLYLIGYLSSLSIFTLNIALLLGLCLSFDYAIFIIFRFREELQQKNHSLDEVVARSVATAGRSVFFSGLAVFISLSALLMFPINILYSVGVGGLAAVFFSVLAAITFLPALLGLLGEGIHRFPILGLHQYSMHKPCSSPGFWHRLGSCVIRRPWLYFVLTLILLLGMGAPFMKAHFGISDLNVLPKHSASNRFLSLFQSHFNENELSPIVLSVKFKNNVLDKENIGILYDFVQRVKKFKAIETIDSIVTLDQELSKEQYQALYQLPQHQLKKQVRQLLQLSNTKTRTLVYVISRYDSNAKETLNLVKKIQSMKLPKGMTLALTGSPVNNLDVIRCIEHGFPYAIAWIMVLTYISLFLLLRSLFLPLKAILMNVLSLSASYGVLVYVFQQGHGHEWLNFIPQGMLDVSLMIIIFCALFGFSMDYEVFLLSRIKECYQATHRNDESIIFGIEKSSKIITSAAAIVIILCGSFMFADVLMVKEFGLGIAIAIFVDAFIIRLFLVPSTMALVSSWNWYVPRCLDHRK